MDGGSLAFRKPDTSDPLVLTTSGRFTVLKCSSSGSITTTGAAINNQSSAALAMCWGSDISSIINNPTVPAQADVRYGVSRGYPGDGAGLLEIPNDGTPTGTQDATSDDCVVSGKKYGSPQRTGTAVTGGGTPVFGGMAQRRA
jgi:hypothetical protein